MNNYTFLICLSIFFLSCNNNSKSKSTQVIIDPNPTSEMAELMRKMTQELKQVKLKLESNDNIDKNLFQFALIHEQHVTDSSFNKAHIEPMSLSFDYAIDNFNTDPTTTNYNNIINNCKSCHQLSCQGPLMIINKLSITANQL